MAASSLASKYQVFIDGVYDPAAKLISVSQSVGGTADDEAVMEIDCSSGVPTKADK